VSSSYRIPASSTDVFEFETVIEPTGAAVVVPKLSVEIASEMSTAQLIEVSDALPIGRATTRTLVGLFTAVYLGVQPLVRDERVNRAWTCIAASNATSQTRSTDEMIQQSLRRVLSYIPTYEIEDGMTLPMGIGLSEWVRDFGERGLGKLALLVATTDANPEALSHALRWIGRIDDRDSVQGRLRLLIGSLDAPSATVKDGAALGLVELGSPLAIGPLEKAASNETNRPLRADLKEAAEYLKQRS